MNKNLNFQKFIFLAVVLTAVFFTSRKPLGSLSGMINNNYEPASTVLKFEPQEQVVESESKTLEPAGAVTLQSTPFRGEASFYRVNQNEPPVIQSESALVADLETGDPYFYPNSSKRWPIASITKLMTAVIAVQAGELDKTAILSSSDFVTENKLNTLEEGASYKVRDLIKALLLISSNEAGEALARLYGRDNFMALMNSQAKSWGLAETFFADPTGISAANQSNGEELAELAKKIYFDYPDIFKITQMRESVITDIASGTSKTLKNINIFSGQAGFIGGKTGYTDEAGGNLLSIFSHQGRPVVVVVLGSADRFGETEKLINWFRNAFSAGS